MSACSGATQGLATSLATWHLHPMARHDRGHTHEEVEATWEGKLCD
jgi:hypothetical protein